MKSTKLSSTRGILIIKLLKLHHWISGFPAHSTHHPGRGLQTSRPGELGAGPGPRRGSQLSRCGSQPPVCPVAGFWPFLSIPLPRLAPGALFALANTSLRCCSGLEVWTRCVSLALSLRCVWRGVFCFSGIQEQIMKGTASTRPRTGRAHSYQSSEACTASPRQTRPPVSRKTPKSTYQ